MPEAARKVDVSVAESVASLEVAVVARSEVAADHSPVEAVTVVAGRWS